MPIIEIEYFKANTPIHRLHPFTKIIFELVIFVVAATFNSPVYLLAVIVGVIGIIALARIPARKFRYMRIVAYIVLFLVFTQGIWFTSFGDFGDIDVDYEWHTLFHLLPAWAPGGPRVPFVLEGAIYGLSLGLRLTAIALAFPILVMTTHPSDLATSLAEIRIGSWRIPYNLIFVFTSALRYIPSVSREFDHTIDAQRSRGVEFEGYNIINQVRASLPLFVPVLTSSLVRAQDLTIALETRAFGANTERTFVHEVKWQWVDWVVSAILVLLAVACVIAVQRYGQGILPYTPQRNF
jgi:energy-coupling factor transport system permease protein